MENEINLLDTLSDKFSYPLPGNKAHLKMASVKTTNPSSVSEKYKKSAVLIVLYPDKDKKIHFLLIRRTIYEGAHSNQVALPGGKKDFDDHSLTDTAIRETYEEVGIRIAKSSILKELSPINIDISHYNIQPFVAFIDHKPNITLNPREVRETYSIPLEELLNDKNVKYGEVQQKPDIKSPYFHLNEQIVWGATAKILSELKFIITNK